MIALEIKIHNFKKTVENIVAVFITHALRFDFLRAQKKRPIYTNRTIAIMTLIR
jgi:hypothetical protein